jgi:hypothetical protein
VLGWSHKSILQSRDITNPPSVPAVPPSAVEYGRLFFVSDEQGKHRSLSWHFAPVLICCPSFSLLPEHGLWIFETARYGYLPIKFNRFQHLHWRLHITPLSCPLSTSMVFPTSARNRSWTSAQDSWWRFSSAAKTGWMLRHCHNVSRGTSMASATSRQTWSVGAAQWRSAIQLITAYIHQVVRICQFLRKP